ncbi:hypothetical protein L3X38_012119 [Prunus dulcis]|uniref:Reverse transcriptase n=1 Tax=Prunus dulcis TaxID=3755 RepID=A0AAD4ZEX5_PRUDU|nr:hypothetical protein L3X38_012119 [Prunus dulcis]
MVAWRRNNKLRGLEDPSGTWHRDLADIKHIAVSYFKELFTTSHPTGIAEITSCVHMRVLVQDNLMLTRALDADEVVRAIKHIHPSKSPGPDGLIGSFYQHYWHLVGPNIIGMVQSFFHSRKLMQKLNHTHLVLIPKNASPWNMTQWRSISLCNMAYKITDNILVVHALVKKTPCATKFCATKNYSSRKVTLRDET